MLLLPVSQLDSDQYLWIPIAVAAVTTLDTDNTFDYRLMSLLLSA